MAKIYFPPENISECKIHRRSNRQNGSGGIIVIEKYYAWKNFLAANRLKIHSVAKGEIHEG